MKTINNVDPSGLSASEFRQYKVVCAALWGYYHKDDIDYVYGYRGQQFIDEWKKPPYVPHAFDCSGYVLWCYKIAGAPDPTRQNYSGQVSTSTLWAQGKLVGTTSYKLSNLEPGDLVFWAASTPHGGNSEHVAVYISDGMVISMGSDAGPLAVSIEAESNYDGAPPLYGMRRYPFGT
jgi:cell wall-associated NlpC family hydrolase